MLSARPESTAIPKFALGDDSVTPTMSRSTGGDSALNEPAEVQHSARHNRRQTNAAPQTDVLRCDFASSSRHKRWLKSAKCFDVVEISAQLTSSHRLYLAWASVRAGGTKAERFSYH